MENNKINDNKSINEELNDEESKIEELEDSEGIGIGRYKFNSFRNERSIRDILTWVEKKKIIIPDFQRDFVWTYNQCSRFIDSILLGLPIPDLFMFRLMGNDENPEQYILIDGLQRYTTIKQFYEGKFKQDGKERKFYINDKTSKWYKKTYDELSDFDKDFFNDYSLKINVFDSIATSRKMQNLYMTSIFERINTGSTKLSQQEVRNAVYDGKVTRSLKNDANVSSFNSLLRDDLNKYMQRSKNEELYLRFLTYNQIYKQINKGSNLFVDEDRESDITSSKQLMLCYYLNYCNDGTIDYKKDSGDLKLVLEKIEKFNNTSFCTVRRDTLVLSNKIHELFAEALVIAVMNGTKIETDIETFNNNKIYIWGNRNKFTEFFESTTNIENIVKRVEVAQQILAGVNLCLK